MRDTRLVKTSAKLIKPKKKRLDSFLTRKRGTINQIGKPFPTQSPFFNKKRPKIIGKETQRAFKGDAFKKEDLKKTYLEKMAIEQERLLTEAGFKGWTIAVQYKDGEVENIPLVARTLDEAFVKAKDKMNQDPSQVYEMVIVDPKIGEILHKIGSSAARVASKIAKGTLKSAKKLGKQVYAQAKKQIKALPAKTEKALVGAARVAGRISAVPTEVRESYAEAKQERPWEKKQKIAKYIESDASVPFKSPQPLKSYVSSTKHLEPQEPTELEAPALRDAINRGIAREQLISGNTKRLTIEMQ
jgi:ribosomal protein S18